MLRVRAVPGVRRVRARSGTRRAAGIPDAMGRGQLKLFSGSAHPALTAEIGEFLGVPIGHSRLQRFPDTEVSFQIDENIRGTDVFVVQPTSAPVDEHLIELCVMMDPT